MKTPKEFFYGLTPETLATLEEEATSNAFVRTVVERGADVLMGELLQVLEETQKCTKEDRIAQMVDLMQKHCVRGFTLGYGFAKLMDEQAAILADAAVSTARGGH